MTNRTQSMTHKINVREYQIDNYQFDEKDFLKHYEEGRFSAYWQKYPFPVFIQLGNPGQAIATILETFETIKAFDNKRFHNFHKGNPYYWLGISYYLLGNFSSAIYFVNAAVKEDLDLDPPNYRSPATFFIELDSDPKEQAGRSLVERAKSEMNKLIQSYKNTLKTSNISATFSIEDLRNKLLKKATNPEMQKHQTISTALISYVLEYETQVKTLRILDTIESIEPFATHLFKGCVLLESILKDNPKKISDKPIKNDLIWWVNKYKTELSIDNLNLVAEDFQAIVNSLPYEQITINDSFSIACKIRNKIGHYLEWEMEIDEKDYLILFTAIGIACLHTINCLYT